MQRGGLVARLGAIGFVAVLFAAGWLQPLDNDLDAMRFGLLRRATTGTVVLVDIDEASIHDVGVWPWDRSIHAMIVDRLLALRAAVIAFDVDFSSRTTPAADQALEDALKRADGAVILAALQQRAGTGSDAKAMRILQSRPLARFSATAWEGSVDVRPDPDGAVRWFSRGELFGDTPMPSLATLLQGGTATSGTFRIDYGIEAPQIDHVSVADLLHGRVEPSRIEGRRVIVGASAVELRDFFQVPRFGLMSGPEVQAMAVESLLQDRALQPVGVPITLAATLAALAVLTLASLRLPLLGLLAATGVTAAIGEGVALAVQKTWPLLPATAPLHMGLLALASVAVVAEIVERRAKLNTARRHANQLRAILDRVIADNFAGIVVVDQDGLVRAVSTAAAAILGLPAQTGTSPFADVLPATLAALVQTAVDSARTGAALASTSCELKLVSAAGTTVTLDCVTQVSEIVDRRIRSRARLGRRDASLGRDFAICLTFQDVTEQRRAQAKLAEMAHVDALSGLANRYVFLTRVTARQARTSERSAAVILLDLDRFKLVNDRLGHAAGDALIQSVAARIRALTGIDVAARLGGDEFALLLERSTPEAILADATALVGQLGGQHTLGPYQVSVLVSVGVAYVEHASTTKEIMSRADAALYAAKSAGGNTVRLYDDAMKLTVADGKQLESDLRDAVQRQEFHVVYQRQVDTAAEQIVGVEALVRWRHPERGFISPAKFIPVAERTGLIEAIGQFVLTTACRDAAAWPLPIKVSVNLSAVQLARSDLSATVMQALSASGLPPERLDLELTESMLMENDALVQSTIERLRATGVKVSLDDFGTGYSSLGYLKSFAIDKVKIDQSFVRDLVTDPSSAAIIRAVIGLARDLGMRVNAEGVETAEQFALLHRLGCDEVQGYLHGRPEPSAAIEASLLVQASSLGALRLAG